MIAGSTGPVKSDVAGSRLRTVGAPVVGRPLEPRVTGAIVRTLGAEPPWYGRPPRPEVIPAEGDADGAPESDPKAVRGISSSKVPRVPPGVGNRVSVWTTVPA